MEAFIYIYIYIYIYNKITKLNENNEMERNFKTLHTPKKKWRGHNKNAICWIFYWVNGDKKVDPTNLPVMRCVCT